MRVLVVGCGSIGRRHLANLHRLKHVGLMACDRDPQALANAKASWPVDTYAHLDSALDCRPDAVLVCTPADDHVVLARRALEAGAHVLIEKPLSVSLEGTSELVALARSRNLIVLVACNLRFHPGVMCLARALRDGVLTNPLCFRSRFSHYLPNWRPGTDYRASYSARRARGGGIIMEGVHEIDYLRWLGGEIVDVWTYAARLSALDIDSEDSALLAMRFESGAVAEVHLDYLSPVKLRGCEVVAVDGVLSWSSVGKAPETVRVELFRSATGRQELLYAAEAYDGNDMYLAELRHFLDCLQGGVPMLDLEGAQRVLVLALMARESAEKCLAGDSIRKAGAVRAE